MPIGFLKARRATTVSSQNPLPVSVQNDTGNALPTEPVLIDTLLIGSVSAGTTAKDLLGNSDDTAATLTQAGLYRRFVLYLFVSSAATITLALKGRATDASGVPLNQVWLDLASQSIVATANTWYRVVFQASDGAPLGADQYRIEVTSTASQTLYYNLKGER